MLGAMDKQRRATLEEIQVLFNDVARGMPVTEACKKQNIPLTAYLRYKNAHQNIGRCDGLSSYLTKPQVVQLVQWCNDMAQRMFPLTSRVVRKVVRRIVEENPRLRNVHDGLPRTEWFIIFARKHKIVYQREHSKVGLPMNLNDGAEALRLSICGDIKSEIPQSQWRLYSQLLFSDESETSEKELKDENSLWESLLNLLLSTIFKKVQPTPSMTYGSPFSTAPLNTREITDTESCTSTKQKKPTSNLTKTKTSGASTPTPSAPRASDAIDSRMEINVTGEDFPRAPEMVLSTQPTEEELFVESIAKQMVAVLSKSDRKKKNKLKIKILELLDTIDSSEEDI